MSCYYVLKIDFYRWILDLVIVQGLIRRCCHAGYCFFLKILNDLILNGSITEAYFTLILHFIHCFSHLIPFTKHFLIALNLTTSFLKRLIYSAIFTDYLYLRMPYFCLELHDCFRENHSFPTMLVILQTRNYFLGLIWNSSL